MKAVMNRLVRVLDCGRNEGFDQSQQGRLVMWASKLVPTCTYFQLVCRFVF
jgi:hypothetical protein